MTEFLQQANAVYLLLLTVAGGVLGFALKARGSWAKSKTNALMEAAQQTRLAVIIEALTISQVREKEGWAVVASVREERDSIVREMGGYREEVAELKSLEEGCRREMNDHMRAYELFKSESAGTARVLRNQIADLQARLHDMSNRLVDKGGTLTGTDLFPREAP